MLIYCEAFFSEKSNFADGHLLLLSLLELFFHWSNLGFWKFKFFLFFSINNTINSKVMFLTESK